MMNFEYLTGFKNLKFLEHFQFLTALKKIQIEILEGL